MRKALIMLLVLALTSICAACFAKNVTVSGVGSTESEAKSDALRMAIEQASGMMIDSQTWVDKAVVIEDKITSRSRGYITNYKVVNSANDDGNWKVTMNVDVVDDPNSVKGLMDALAREGLIQEVALNPRIAVVIPEMHLNYRVPNPTGETALIKKFIESGFNNMVDISDTRTKLNNPMLMNQDELASLANSLRADILIVGEAFSESAGDVGKFLPGQQRTGIQSCRARVEAKMYYARTGQIIAADGKAGSGADTSQAIAGKKALANAGDALGEYFVTKFMEAIGRGNTSMEVIANVSSYQDANKITAALGQVNGVKDLQLRNYADGKAIFSMVYTGSPESLFNQLQKNSECTVEMSSTAYKSLTVNVY